MSLGIGATGASAYQSLSPLMRSFCARGAFACEASQRRQTLCGPDAMASSDGLAKAALYRGPSLRANIILDDTDQSDGVECEITKVLRHENREHGTVFRRRVTPVMIVAMRVSYLCKD